MEGGRAIKVFKISCHSKAAICTKFASEIGINSYVVCFNILEIIYMKTQIGFWTRSSLPSFLFQYLEFYQVQPPQLLPQLE